MHIHKTLNPLLLLPRHWEGKLTRDVPSTNTNSLPRYQPVSPGLEAAGASPPLHATQTLDMKMVLILGLCLKFWRICILSPWDVGP